MKATAKHIVKKVTLELIYDVVDERTKEINARIDQIHTRLDQIMHMLAELRK